MTPLGGMVVRDLLDQLSSECEQILSENRQLQEEVNHLRNYWTSEHQGQAHVTPYVSQKENSIWPSETGGPSSPRQHSHPTISTSHSHSNVHSHRRHSQHSNNNHNNFRDRERELSPSSASSPRALAAAPPSSMPMPLHFGAPTRRPSIQSTTMNGNVSERGFYISDDNRTLAQAATMSKSSVTSAERSFSHTAPQPRHSLRSVAASVASGMSFRNIQSFTRYRSGEQEDNRDVTRMSTHSSARTMSPDKGEHKRKASVHSFNPPAWMPFRRNSSAPNLDHHVVRRGSILNFKVQRRMSIQEALAAAGVATQGNASPYLINPEHSDFLQRWDVCTLVVLCFVAVVVPVQVAMIPVKFDAMFMLGCVVDFVFLIDMVLQFFIMYYKRTDFGFALEYQHKAIVRHYVKTWFPVDIASTIPVDLFSLLFQSSAIKQMKVVKTVRLLRLLKLARLARLSRLFRRMMSRTSIPHGKMAILKFFAILFLVTHWLACLWALTLVLVEEDEGIPRWVDSFDEQDANISTKTKDTPWKLYVTCLYFTSYTITSVGYGDIGPANIVETITAIIMIIVSGVSWAIVLGQVSGIVTQLDTEEQAFRSQMDELNAMMEDRVLSDDMRRRLRGFFFSHRFAQRRERHRGVISAMSPGLQGEVLMQINKRWLERVSLFKSIMHRGLQPRGSTIFRAFVVDVSQRMETAFHAQSEFFGIPHVLYILNRGLVGCKSRICQSGSVWGEDFMLKDTHLIDNYEAFALTYVALTALRRSVFFEIIEKHAPYSPELHRQVRYYCCWLAFQRALLHRARKGMLPKRCTTL